MRSKLLGILGVVAGCVVLGMAITFLWLIGTTLHLGLWGSLK